MHDLQRWHVRCDDGGACVFAVRGGLLLGVLFDGLRGLRSRAVLIIDGSVSFDELLGMWAWNLLVRSR